MGTTTATENETGRDIETRTATTIQCLVSFLMQTSSFRLGAVLAAGFRAQVLDVSCRKALLVFHRRACRHLRTGLHCSYCLLMPAPSLTCLGDYWKETIERLLSLFLAQYTIAQLCQRRSFSRWMFQWQPVIYQSVVVRPQRSFHASSLVG